jgi:hypothetical protein
MEYIQRQSERERERWKECRMEITKHLEQYYELFVREGRLLLCSYMCVFYKL